MSDTNELERLFDLYEKDLDLYRSKRYNIQKPIPPEKKELSILHLIGPTIAQLTVVAGAAFILSGSRTGMFFYILEKLMAKTYDIDVSKLPEIQATLSVLVFELAVTAAGFFDGRLSLRKMMHENKSVTDIKPPGTISKTAYVVLVGAGILSILPAIGIDQDLLNSITGYFGLVAVIGVIVVLHESARFMAIAFASVPLFRDQIIEKYTNDLNAWLRASEKAFTSDSRYYRKDNYRLTDKAIAVQDEEQHKSKSDIAYDWIEQFVLENNKIPTVTEVADGTSAGRTLSSKQINKYIINNKTALLNKGIVQKSRIDTLERR